MRRPIFYLTCALLLLLGLSSTQAQTLSDCVAPPPMRPNVKPGVGNLTVTRDGKTLVVSGGDGRIRFIDINTGEVRRNLLAHENALYTTTFSRDEKLMG